MENSIIKTFYIKNMVCTRCLILVQNIFEAAHYDVKNCCLGEITVAQNAFSHNASDIDTRLRTIGLELLQNEDDLLVEQVKMAIVRYIQEIDTLPKVKLTDYLSETIQLPYTQLRRTFRAATGLTIEKYFILQKVERAKELLQYDDLSIKEIAYKLGYSSLQHLSSQFKTVTGHSPKSYRNQNLNLRISLDCVGLAVAS